MFSDTCLTGASLDWLRQVFLQLWWRYSKYPWIDCASVRLHPWNCANAHHSNTEPAGSWKCGHLQGWAHCVPYSGQASFDVLTAQGNYNLQIEQWSWVRKNLENTSWWPSMVQRALVIAWVKLLPRVETSDAVHLHFWEIQSCHFSTAALNFVAQLSAKASVSIYSTQLEHS